MAHEFSDEEIHVLRSALTVMRGYTQVLQRHLRQPRAPKSRLSDYANGLAEELVRLEQVLRPVLTSNAAPTSNAGDGADSGGETLY